MMEQYSCDEDESESIGQPSRLQHHYIEERLNNEAVDNLEELDFADLADEGSDLEDNGCNTETGSCMARSIISNILQQVGSSSEDKAHNDDTDEKEELEHIEAEGDSEIQEVEILRALSTSPGSQVSVPQSPRTAARVSSWINDLESLYSKDEFHVNSKRSAPTNIEGIEINSIPPSEDDQPSGYTTLISPSSKLNASGFESTSIKPTRTSFSPVAVQQEFNDPFTEESFCRKYDLGVNNQLVKRRGAASEFEYKPRNHYMRIVEKTIQTLKREEDGTQTVDTVRTVEKCEKDLDKSAFSGLKILCALFLVVVVVALVFDDLLPLNYRCLTNMKKITNQTRSGGIFS